MLEKVDPVEVIMHKALSNDEIIQRAPSVLTREGMPEKTHSAYVNVSTMDVIEVMRNQGWIPTLAGQQKVRVGERSGYQKHIVKLSNPNLVIGPDHLQAIITNSHDGGSAYKFDLGIYRFVCSNGMIVGNTFESINIRHIAISTDEVLQASQSMLDFAPQVANQIESMKSTRMTSPMNRAFARASMLLVYGEDGDGGRWPFDPGELLRIRHEEDRKDHSLWTSYNAVQENIMKGGIEYKTEKGRAMKTRPVKAIDRHVNLNKALHSLATEMAELAAK